MTSFSTVKYNVIANFVGRFWSVLMNLVFVPFYIRFMGVESYGLVGIFVSMVAMLSILDMGLSTTLNREVARLSIIKEKYREERDLVRTLEKVYWYMGGGIGFGIAAMAPLIARYWLSPENLTAVTVTEAVILMGVVIAFQWPVSLYSGGLAGLQRQVLLNVVIVVATTFKGVGSVLVLWLVEPSIRAFFVWQVFVSAAQSVAMFLCLWRVLPVDTQRPVFRKSLLLANWQFAAGVMGITMVATVLTQMDKILLSRILSLRMFGYYALAAAVAAGLGNLVGPIFTALFPRFTQLATTTLEADLARLYHRGCQFASLFIFPIFIAFVLFSHEILLFWLHDPLTVKSTETLLSLLAAGTMLNSLVVLPYALQLAHGWTKLSFYKNFVAIVLLVPLMSWLVAKLGAPGGGLAWVILNAGYLFIEVPIMHRYLLRGEMRQWYLVDVGIPFVISLLIIGIGRILIVKAGSNALSLLWIGLFMFSAMFLSMLAMPATREMFFRAIARLRSNILLRVYSGV